MGAPIKWTDEANAMLSELWQSQLTLTEIASELPIKVSHDAVRNQAIRLKLGDRPKRVRRLQDWTEEDDGKIRSMLATGHSRQEIAKAVGRSASAVNYRLREVAQDILAKHNLEDSDKPDPKPDPSLPKLWLSAMITVARAS